MGPPEFTGGNDVPDARYLPPADGLQWGRRNSPAETPTGAASSRRWKARFNGAAGIHRRKLSPAAGHSNTAPIASMGPPEFTGGNPPEDHAAGSLRHAASMGPPEFTGGNAVIPTIDTILRRLLQWGRRNSPAETVVVRGHHSSILIKLQWGRRNSPAETWACRQPWACPCTSFNGAAGIHRRKQESDRLTYRSCLVLQWGRRNSPAETHVWWTERQGRAALQWGRRNSPAETPRRTGCGGSSSGFNGAAGIHRRKRAPGSRRQPPGAEASMGPPEFTGGNASPTNAPASD